MKKIKILLIILSVLIIQGCTNSSEATRILKENGYKNINITGWGWFKCSQDDFFATKFDALSTSGKKVSGTVCSGLIFKGSTIRFN